MGLKLIDVTGKDIYEAIEKDGIPLVRERWFKVEGKEVSACLLGTAGMNLGVLAHSDPNYYVDADYSLFSQLNAVNEEDGPGVGTVIINRFDETVNIFEIADDAKWAFQSANPDYESWDTYMEDSQKVWNEAFARAKVQYPDKVYEDGRESEDRRYKLNWEESLAMAKEALASVWNKTFQVQVYDYSTPDFLNSVED